jgi:hypothetical protein
VIGQNEREQTLSASNGFRSRLRWRALASAVLFLIIPICFVISVSQLTHAKGPQWLPYTFDNSYNYLFNSLGGGKMKLHMRAGADARLGDQAGIAVQY